MQNDTVCKTCPNTQIPKYNKENVYILPFETKTSGGRQVKILYFILFFLCKGGGAPKSSYMLTKELWYSNETGHALNSTFLDTYCIVSFQINPLWISHEGLWKIALETFHEYE